MSQLAAAIGLLVAFVCIFMAGYHWGCMVKAYKQNDEQTGILEDNT